ncbi:MAG: FtsX-like permease family protein, partial [Candidatus Thermoplasmatota archaeon]|nr:FtsX-like permease family protein [Candidatus Thermoplasmatota archaeon]
LLMNLSERDSELATLRVLGAPISRIRMMILGEHFAIGLIGGVLSAAFTIVMAQYLISQLVQWAFYFTLQPNFAGTLQLILIVVVISVLSTPIGTSRVSRMDLVEKVKDLSQ